MSLCILKRFDRLTDAMVLRSPHNRTSLTGSETDFDAFRVKLSSNEMNAIAEEVKIESEGEFRIYNDKCAYEIAGAFRFSEPMAPRDIKKLKRIPESTQKFTFDFGEKTKIDVVECGVSYPNNKKLILIFSGTNVCFNLNDLP